jgi:hypothetical protein
LSDNADGRQAPASELGLTRIFRPPLTRAAPGIREAHCCHLRAQLARMRGSSRSAPHSLASLLAPTPVRLTFAPMQKGKPNFAFCNFSEPRAA